MRVVRFLLQASPRIFWLVVFLNLVGGAIGLGQLMLVNRALKAAPEHWLFAAFVATIVLTSAARVYSRLKTHQLVRGAVARLQVTTARRLLETPLRHIESLGSSALISIFTEDIPYLANTLVSLPQIVMNSTVAAACIVYLAWLAPRLCVPLVLGIFLGTWGSSRFMAKSAFAMREARVDSDFLLKHFRALTDGMKDLKIYKDRRELFKQSLSDTADRQRRSYLRAAVLGMPMEQFSYVILYGVIALTIFWPAFFHIESQTSVIFAIVSLSGRLAIIDEMSAFFRASVLLKVIEEKRISLMPMIETVGEAPLSSSWKQLQLSGVSYAYHHQLEQRNFSMGPVDLSFRPGEIVFLTGGNGSGKTTLAKLILGLYEPEAGTVTLDDLPITEGNMEAYRQMFSTVFADNFMFEEVQFPFKDNFDAQSTKLLNKLGLDHKVSIKDGVFSTVALSQGQRKRLALLGAYAHDAPIMVFDEWAAEQDPEFKDFFYRSLLPELRDRGKLVIALTHDDRYFPLADRIIHLNDGRVAEIRYPQTELRPSP